MQSQFKKFTAPLERYKDHGLNWVIARLPFSVEETWGTRGILRVHVRVNGFEYRTSLLPTGSGEHFILVNRKVQKAARISPGSVAAFELTPDLAPRVLIVPKELEETLQQDRRLKKWFDQLSHSARKWLSDLVVGAKSVETRRKRAERVAGHGGHGGRARSPADDPACFRQASRRRTGMEEHDG
jgi:hypothetical protein